jgi:subtilisin family serine protease
VVSSGSTVSTETASGDTTSSSILQTPENIEQISSLTNDESDIDLSDISQKAIVDNTVEKNPEREILVQFKSDIDGYVGQYQIDQIENVHDLTTNDTISEQNIAVMEISTTDMMSVMSSVSVTETFSQSGTTNPVLEEAIDAKIEELKADPRVKHAQRNFVYTISSLSSQDPRIQSTNNTVMSTWTGRTIPSGSGFSKLWGLDNQGQSVDGIVGTPDADIDYPEAIAYAGGRLGTGVLVAVLDTGVAYNHPDLVGSMWDGANCLSDTGATLGGCIHGYDFSDNDLDPMDSHGHGTHVAGTI